MVEKKKKVVVPLRMNQSASSSHIHDGFGRIVARQFPGMGENSGSVTVMLLEIDDFEGLRKVFGVDRCGRMLDEVASILKRILRENDLVAFYGKKRLGLVLRGTGSESACEVGERIRAVIKEAAFAPEHGHVLKDTVSCGHATQTDKSCFSSPDDLIQAAFECLREASESGEDRIVGYQLPSENLEFPEVEAKD